LFTKKLSGGYYEEKQPMAPWPPLTIVLLATACQKQTTETTASMANDKVNLRKSLLNKPGSNNTITGSVKVFATGLNNPRELKFGPDGYLYVAEGGTGGTNSTVG
jgi:glucose/arabinose dehydrogenase